MTRCLDCAAPLAVVDGLAWYAHAAWCPHATVVIGCAADDCTATAVARAAYVDALRGVWRCDTHHVRPEHGLQEVPA
jgi:hypothetical protein